MTTSIDKANSPFINLQCIANHQSFRTQADEDAEKAVLSYHYEAKRNICIVSIVAIVATAAILGGILNPRLAIISIGVFAPIGGWVYFSAKHNNLRELHISRIQESLDIIINLGNYLSNIREEKIKELLNERSLEAALKSEENYDKKTNYNEICNLAGDAGSLIQQKYHVNYMQPWLMEMHFSHQPRHPLYNFVYAAHLLAGPNTEKDVICFEYGKLCKKKTNFHQSFSVIAGEKTNILKT